MGSNKGLNCRLRDIQRRLTDQGHRVSCPVISRLLRAEGDRLRQNVKACEETAHPERGLQFAYLQQQREQHAAAGQPRLSVDTKLDFAHDTFGFIDFGEHELSKPIGLFVYHCHLNKYQKYSLCFELSTNGSERVLLRCAKSS